MDPYHSEKDADNQVIANLMRSIINIILKGNKLDGNTFVKVNGQVVRVTSFEVVSEEDLQAEVASRQAALGDAQAALGAFRQANPQPAPVPVQQGNQVQGVTDPTTAGTEPQPQPAPVPAPQEPPVNLN